MEFNKNKYILFVVYSIENIKVLFLYIPPFWIRINTWLRYKPENTINQKQLLQKTGYKIIEFYAKECVCNIISISNECNKYSRH